MPTHDLMKSQRNEILLQIQQAGFNPVDFRWQEATSKRTDGLKVPQLLHVPSRFWYRFELQKGLHACEFSPGDQTLTKSAYPGSWEAQRSYFDNWLEYLQREVDAPDLWETVKHEAALFGTDPVAGSQDNSVFSAAEKERIRASVDELRKYILTVHVADQDRIALVNERLDYLIESSERLGRKDWKTFALGVFANVVVGAALAPDAARDMIRVAGSVLGWVFGAVTLLPSPLL